MQQVGSYLGYCGRGTEAFGKAARGPKAALQKCGYCAPVLLKIVPVLHDEEAVLARIFEQLAVARRASTNCKTPRELGWAEADVRGARFVMDRAPVCW